MNGECTDCYLSSNLPTTVKDEPWVWAHNFAPPSFFLRTEKREHGTIALRRAIVEGHFEVSIDGHSISLLLAEGRRYELPLTVEALDQLALRTGLLVGKWLIHRPRIEIDKAWLVVAKATFDKTLGRGAKVSTVSSVAENREGSHVICVYTRNYLDLEDVGRVRSLLRKMGFVEPLCYKPDIYTYLNIYYGTTKIQPCRYRE